MDVSRFCRLSVSAAVVVLATQAARAFSFTPSMIEFTLGSAVMSQTFTAVNPGDTKIAVQISAHSRVVDEDGKEALPETTHLTVFPKQLVLEPKQSKAVRVTYVGPKSLERQAAYRVVAEQLPVDLKSIKPTEGMNLKFLIKYQTSVYVTPAGARPSVRLENVRRLEPAPGSKDGKAQMQLEFVNTGNAYRVLDGAKVKIRPLSPATSAAKATDWFSLTGEIPQQLQTINVLAGQRRRVVVPWPSAIPATPTTAAYEGTVDFN